MFGAEFAGREIIYDSMNKDLFLKMLKNYNQWQYKNGQFHPGFDSDYSKLKRLSYYTYVGFFFGVMFAGTVWNPNFVKRRSWWMRKFSLIGFGYVGMSLAQRYYEDQITNMMLKMNDYFPLEIKRALQDKDFRHLALFDLDEVSKKRQLFDPATGKSLS